MRFQGFHGNVLIVLDEAPGVLPEIYEAIEGIRAGGDVRVLALGNPTIASGPFYGAFAAHRESWNLITISAFDTPNLAGLTLESLLQLPEEQLDQNVCPYLTTRRWVKEKYFEWGPGYPLWEARVLGNLPLQSADALLSLAWLEAAKYRESNAEGPLHGGLDVAGPGEDETVLCVRCGPRIVLLKAWAGKDPRGDVLAALMPFKDRLQSVNVDTVGIGYYMAQHLKDDGVQVQEVNVGGKAYDSEKYANRKAELYWGLRARTQEGDMAGLTDDCAIAQLAGIRYSHNSRGQVVIESKDEARKRGVKSPDPRRGRDAGFRGNGTSFRTPRVFPRGNRKVQGGRRKAESSGLLPAVSKPVPLAVRRCVEMRCVRCRGDLGRRRKTAVSEMCVLCDRRSNRLYVAVQYLWRAVWGTAGSSEVAEPRRVLKGAGTRL